MSHYRVLSASYLRGYGILGVEEESIDGRRGDFLYVEGNSNRIVQIQTMRHVFDEANNLTGRRVMIIRRPEFPIKELVGAHLSHCEQHV